MQGVEGYKINLIKKVLIKTYILQLETFAEYFFLEEKLSRSKNWIFSWKYFRKKSRNRETLFRKSFLL